MRRREAAQNFAGDFPFVGTKENAVAFLDVQLRLQRGFLGLRKKFHNRRFPLAILDLDKGKTFGAVQLCNFSEFIGLSDGDSGKAFRVDRFHHAAGIERASENFEAAFSKDFSKIDKLHSKPAIGFIAAEAIDGVAVSEPVEWRFDVEVERCLENRRQHSFGNGEDVLRHDERRFNVDLRKLRLAVGAQIFVAETFRDLKILFHASDHEELFVLLRRLRQRVEFSRRDPARHQKIARAFRRALGKNGRFDFDKALAVEVIARRLCRAMAHPQITRETRPPQIQIAVRHSQIFVLRLGIDRERQRVGAIENAQLARE